MECLKLRSSIAIAIYSTLFLIGCASNETLRTPAETAPLKIERRYRTTLSCEAAAPLDAPKTRQSALVGYSVGPTALNHFPDLEKPVLRPFLSDGCSSSPDGFLLAKEAAVWIDCCIHHDTAYWLGGTLEEKAEADSNLEICIAQKEYPRIAKFYAAVVSHFGRSNSSQIYRWGYGWNSRRSYGPLSANEQAQVEALYGISGEALRTKLFNETVVLEKYCDTFDPVFYGLRTEEKIAYAKLNEILKTNDQIEWSKWGYFNRDFRNFEVKLRSCTNLVIFKFARRTPTLLSLESAGCF